jgi:hypothetical protein
MICPCLSYKKNSHKGTKSTKKNWLDHALAQVEEFLFCAFAPFVAIPRARCGWRNGLVLRWSSCPFCRGCDGGKC